MATRFVTVDRDTALLLPPDMREWVPSNHPVHFELDTVEQLNLRAACLSFFSAPPGKWRSHFPLADWRTKSDSLLVTVM